MIQGLEPLLKDAECVEANGTLSNKELRALCITFQHVSTLGTTTADVTLVLRMAHHNQNFGTVAVLLTIINLRSITSELLVLAIGHQPSKSVASHGVKTIDFEDLTLATSMSRANLAWRWACQDHRIPCLPLQFGENGGTAKVCIAMIFLAWEIPRKICQAKPNQTIALIIWVNQWGNLSS